MKTNICFIILFMLCKISLVYAQRIPPEENKLQFRSLQWLYESIKNPNKNLLLQNWNFSDSVNFDLSSWEGIALDNNGYIIEIDISGKGLKAEFGYDTNNPDLPSQNMFCLVYLSKLKSINLSNNQFSGFFPALDYQEGGHLSRIYTLENLEYLYLNNNLFDVSISTTQNSTKKLKELRANNNKLKFITLQHSPNLEIVDLQNNELIMAGFFTSPDTAEIVLDSINLMENKLNFWGLWHISNPESGYHALFYEPSVKYLYMPQDPVPMTTIYNRKVRAQINDTVKVELPDVGQNNQQFPEIRDSLRYQWYKEGLALANDTLVYLERLGLDSVDYGQYHCKIFYKGERLKHFSLITETFDIIGDTNQLPVISIENGVPQYQRIRKGYTSAQTQLSIIDDLPINIEESTYTISKHPKHLQLLDSGQYILVKDTSHSMWTGIDTLEVTYCDFEGGCTSFELYYEVYDVLYAPPIDTFWVTENREMILKWDTAFYARKTEKPDGYCVMLDTCFDVTGSSDYYQIDSITVQSADINFVSFRIPESENEFLLRVRLCSKKNDALSQNTTFNFFPLATKPDTNLQATIYPDGIHLTWELTTTERFIPITDPNLIYRSEDDINFTIIGKTTLNQNSYTDNTIVENKTYQYKLVKLAKSSSRPAYEFELPYLESNIVRISTGNIILTTGVSLNKDTLSLALDSAKTLLATIIPDSATNPNITWESRNTNIATVSNTGLVRAIAEGETYVVVITQDGGLKDSCLVTIEANVGIESLQLQSEELKIYPNPIKNQLIIERGDFVIKSIEISDSKGSMQKNYSNLKNTTGNIVLDISSLSSGVYFVTIKTSVGDMVKKVIKE